MSRTPPRQHLVVPFEGGNVLARGASETIPGNICSRGPERGRKWEVDCADGIPTTITGYPKPYEVEQFFGAYFHQDWGLEADDWQGIVDQFSTSATLTSEQLNELADNLDHLTSRYSEDRLAGVILDFGGYYDPRPEMTFNEWLRQVAERLRQNAKSIDTS